MYKSDSQRDNKHESRPTHESSTATVVASRVAFFTKNPPITIGIICSSCSICSNANRDAQELRPSTSIHGYHFFEAIGSIVGG
jgi:hypothetical protein